MTLVARASNGRRLACAALGVVTAACTPPAGLHEREFAVHRYLYGTVGSAGLDVRDVCTSGRASQVRVTRRAADYLLSVATLGIYVPHRVVVRCR